MKKVNVKLGERDENGHFKVPYTHYGLRRNLAYVFRKMIQYRKILIPMFVIGAITQSVVRYLWSFIAKFLIDIIETQASSGTKDLKPLLFMLVVMMVVELVCVGTNAVVQNRVGYRFQYVQNRINGEKNAKLLSMPYQTLEQPHILDLHQRAGNALGDWQGVGSMMNRTFLLTSLACTMIVTATTIVVLDWRLILVLTAAMLTNYASQRWSIRDDKKHFWDATAMLRRKLHYMERCTQDFNYAKDIRLFAMEPWLLDKQRSVLKESEQKYRRSRNFWLRHSYIYSTTSLIAAIVMYYVLITEVLKQSISIGDFTLYLGLCATFSAALSDFYDNFGQLQQASMFVDDLRTFMDLKEDTPPKENNVACTEIPETFPGIEFRNVCFRYEGAEEDTIKDLSLCLPAGQRLAIVGLNGAGKTTFVKLLLRLYEPTKGEILLGDEPASQYRREEYFGLFAPVFQDVEVFAFPMNQNVSMKTKEETDQARADESLSMAGLSEKLATLKNGSETELLKVISEEGVDLSGGERQKLALARALYKNTPVIVLDEPTAALDALAEYELYQRFDRMIGDKTAVYISHRLSSTRFCDRIAMFEKGRIIEYGTHEELLKRGGAYTRMFEMQAQYYETAGGDDNAVEQ